MIFTIMLILIYTYFILIKKYISYKLYIFSLFLVIYYTFIDFSLISIFNCSMFIIILIHSYYGICEIIHDYISDEFISYILRYYILHLINISTIISFTQIIENILY